MQIPPGVMFKAIGCEMPPLVFFPKKKLRNSWKKPDLQNNTTLRLTSFGLNFDVFLPNPKSPWNSHPHPPETLQWAVAMQGSKGYIQSSMSGTSNIATDDECTAGAIWNIDLHEHVKIYILYIYICVGLIPTQHSEQDLKSYESYES